MILSKNNSHLLKKFQEILIILFLYLFLFLLFHTLNLLQYFN